MESTRQTMHYARKGGGFTASRPAENIGVRTARLSVRVMYRERVGRPVKGDRRALGTHAFGIAEYHGNRCFRVITGTDSLMIAGEIAAKTAAALGKDAIVIGILDSKRPAPVKATAKRSTTLKIKRSDATIKARESADAQALHVRDINNTGACLSCGSKNRAHPCGKSETPVSAPVPAKIKSFADAFAATAHLRAE